MEEKKKTAIALSLFFLLSITSLQVRSDGSDHRYKINDTVPLYANKVGPFHLNKLQPGQFQVGIQRFHHTIPSSRISSSIITAENQTSDENISCLLTMGLSTHNSKKSDEKKKPQPMLFGQPILIEQQISLTFSGGPVSPVLTGNSCSDGNKKKTAMRIPTPLNLS